jgi:hypothetical protein
MLIMEIIWIVNEYSLLLRFFFICHSLIKNKLTDDKYSKTEIVFG